MIESWERPQLEPKGKAYRLSSDWRTNCKGVIDFGNIVIPKGFVTDGASIPRALWTICGTPMDNPRIYAAIVHDWIYANGGEYIRIDFGTSDDDRKSGMRSFTRKEADKIYRDYQIALGISKLKAYTEYYALRLFGGSHWDVNGE